MRTKKLAAARDQMHKARGAKNRAVSKARALEAELAELKTYVKQLEAAIEKGQAG